MKDYQKYMFQSELIAVVTGLPASPTLLPAARSWQLR